LSCSAEPTASPAEPGGPTEIAIVGLGPWGLAILERLLVVAERRHRPLVVHVIEPGKPGCGTFRVDHPDFLPLNTPCGQHVMHPDGEASGAHYAVSLFHWAVQAGYRWVGDACRTEGDGRPLTPDDFLPRRLMGEWLHWSYQQIIADRAPWIAVIHHDAEALGIDRGGDSHERVWMSDGQCVCVDHAILATGHTPDHPVEGTVPALPPYPLDRFRDAVRPGSVVAVSGLGLVALDVVAGLTVGRGGRFLPAEGRLRYVRSGDEPEILLFSRSGQPYAAKAERAIDPTGDYSPVICTAEAILELRDDSRCGLKRAAVDFRRDVLPMILAEMQVRFYRQSALILDGTVDAAERVTDVLMTAWREGRFESVRQDLSARYGSFELDRQVTGDSPSRTYSSTDDYQNHVYKLMADDVAEATRSDLTSPVKAAYETLRILRDDIRFVVEFQGLTPESYRDFRANLANRMKALVAGPPARRAAELLALIEAGVVKTPWGPEPSVILSDEGSVVIESSRLTKPFRRPVDHLIQGHLPEPTIERTASPLLVSLKEAGRIRQFRYANVDVGSIALTDDLNPIGTEGEVHERLWFMGPLTEGIRYFTEYVPSPKSRARVFADAERFAQVMLQPTRPVRVNSEGDKGGVDSATNPVDPIEDGRGYLSSTA
jgi:uncharacterized NAD(P)/FAD-binding protein YdhS